MKMNSHYVSYKNQILLTFFLLVSTHALLPVFYLMFKQFNKTLSACFLIFVTGSWKAIDVAKFSLNLWLLWGLWKWFSWLHLTILASQGLGIKYCVKNNWNYLQNLKLMKLFRLPLNVCHLLIGHYLLFESCLEKRSYFLGKVVLVYCLYFLC